MGGRALISNAAGKVDVLGVTSTELGYVSGVTSGIQTQLNGKAPIASPTFTGDVNMPGTGIWNSSGNVGIGTTAPNYKLQVGASGDGTSAIANAWNVFSDIRLKKDIQPIKNALNIILNLQGVGFNWEKSNQQS